MDKKIIIGIVVVIIIVLGTFLVLNNGNQVKRETGKISKGKTLVVYYSATGSTKKVAQGIAKNLNADLFEIEPSDAYTSADLNWSDDNSRVTKEHNDESLRNIELKNTKVSNWSSYDTVLIGYPIWWNEASWVINNFVKDNDFTGKTVIPFCTSASSGIENSVKLLEKMTKTGNWKSGYRFSSSATDDDIKSFTDSIK